MAIFAMAAMAFTGCSEKEENPFNGQTTNFTLSVADMNGQKAHMDGNYACWDNGDAVNINGETYAVTVVNNDGVTINGDNNSGSVDGSDAALIDVPMADNYYAIFPADAATGNVGATTTVNFPSEYTYTATAGGQKIEAPMAAKANGNNLSFKCLTTLWKVNIPAWYNVDSIVINADNDILAGTGTVNVETGAVSALSGSKTVTLNCNGAVGGNFYIPVLPIHHGTKVSVTAFVSRQLPSKNSPTIILNWTKTAKHDITNHFIVNLEMPDTPMQLLTSGLTKPSDNAYAYISTGVYQTNYNSNYRVEACISKNSDAGFMFGNAYTQFRLANLPDNDFHNVIAEWDGTNHIHFESIDDAIIVNETKTWGTQFLNSEIRVLGLGLEPTNHGSYACPANVKTCKIYVDDVLVRDFTAVTFGDVSGLFDNVTGAFYTF